MPLVRISLREGTNPEYRKAIADGVHQAMIDARDSAEGPISGDYGI
jgi:phenylpyruvate tautomerase PptA (4-oxalocrotonate tautomerase family)